MEVVQRERESSVSFGDWEELDQGNVGKVGSD